jgi:hypothetical protein
MLFTSAFSIRPSACLVNLAIAVTSNGGDHDPLDQSATSPPEALHRADICRQRADSAFRVRSAVASSASPLVPTSRRNSRSLEPGPLRPYAFGLAAMVPHSSPTRPGVRASPVLRAVGSRLAGFTLPGRGSPRHVRRARAERAGIARLQRPVIFEASRRLARPDSASTAYRRAVQRAARGATDLPGAQQRARRD